ncbi:MAG TPA: type II toxin-antitoxin system RelE/ParE family toxin [Fodinibius sp.]|nr:type II toxin-antitoxin system RelE/ParE family toxin [Fodinibius sp.]
MTFRYLPEARQELDRQIAKYEKKESGVGLKFLDEVEYAIGRAMANPTAWSPIDPGIRRCLTQRFPYGVVYQYREDEQEILVVAIMHTRRKPGYWKRRL